MQTGWGRVAGSVYKNCSMGASSVRAIIYRVSISTGISPFSYLDMVERLFPMSPAMSSRVIFRFFRHSRICCPTRVLISVIRILCLSVPLDGRNRPVRCSHKSKKG